MKEKIVSAIFTVGFAVTGCSVDSIFEGGLICWLAFATITAISGCYLLNHTI